MQNDIYIKPLLCIACFFILSSCGNLDNYNNNYANRNVITNNKKYKVSKNYTGYYKIGNPYIIDGKKYYPKINNSYREIGMASWYGDDCHNKKTANGEIFNMNDITAAHKTLPLPSIVKITNLENGKNILVRVNDRGPFVDNRVIDVSKKVAELLGFKEKGLTKVKVEFMKNKTENMLKNYGLR